MIPSDLPFGALRQLLFDLGFEVKVLPASSVVGVPSVAFRHAATGTVFLFREYGLKERVSRMDLMGVRGQLDLQGMLSEEAFDDALRMASA